MGDYIPDVMVFQRVFSNFNDSEQNLLKLNIVGGFQTGCQKSQWDEDTKPECELCSEPDDRVHRLLHCSHLKDVRENMKDACHVISDVRQEWAYMPIPRLHDQVVMLRAFLKTVREPEIIAPRNCDIPVMRFFTDGGAKYPKSPDARIATWALIQDISVNERQVKDVADFLHLQPPQCPLFFVSAVGIVPGEQTVARAELFAVLVAVKKVHWCDPIPKSEFVTDAAYVCNVVRLIENDAFHPYLHKFANGDLIQQLATLWRKDKFTVTKALSNFSPDGFVSRPAIPVDEESYHLCLQGANIAKGFKLWSELLRWPPDLQHDYDAKGHGDWGISWFELLVSFYLSTGMRCPIKTGGDRRVGSFAGLHWEQQREAVTSVRHFVSAFLELLSMEVNAPQGFTAGVHTCDVQLLPPSTMVANRMPFHTWFTSAMLVECGERNIVRI
eukprot:s3008_g8.t1